MLVLNRQSIMANKTIDMSRIRQIIRLYTQGTSKKKISTLTASSRNTVKKYISKFIQERLTYEGVEAVSDYALDLLFSVEPPPPKDERYEELQRLLPGIEVLMLIKEINHGGRGAVKSVRVFPVCQLGNRREKFECEAGFLGLSFDKAKGICRILVLGAKHFQEYRCRQGRVRRFRSGFREKVSCLAVRRFLEGFG